MIKRAPDDGPAYRKFVGATYGASVLTRDEDYTAASGSLILTLQPDFLETLDPGTNTVNAYDFDTPVTENLTLYAKWTANSAGSGTSGSSSSSSTRSSYVSGPKTGDPGRTGLWAVVLLISMAGLSGAAAAYGRSRRKEKPAVQAGQNEGGQEAD